MKRRRVRLESEKPTGTWTRQDHMVGGTSKKLLSQGKGQLNQPVPFTQSKHPFHPMSFFLSTKES